MRVEWDASTKALVERLRKKEPESEPFELDAGRYVVDPVKFHQALIGDADAGPEGPRSLTGSFQSDLKSYLAKND